MSKDFQPDKQFFWLNLALHLFWLNQCEHVGKDSGVHGEIKQSTINQTDICFHLLRLNQREHIGKDGGVHSEIKQSTINQNDLELRIHLLRLHQCKHIGKYGGVHGEPCRVRRIRHHAEHVLQDVCVVPANV